MTKEKKLMIESISKVLDLDGGLDLLKYETFAELTAVKSELIFDIEMEGKE
tara:strand:- start:796 stop:948 length:153 start_codon:yes stop_codon:yes gene_type:complete